MLTPLMMDFGYKDKAPPAKKPKRWLRPDAPEERPIVDQVWDLFRRVRDVAETPATALRILASVMGASDRPIDAITVFLWREE